MLTLGEVLRLQAVKRPSDDALVYPRKDQTWTYGELNGTANRFAHALTDLGVGAGDRVSTILHNTSEFVAAYFATAKLGAVFNPLNYRLDPDGVEYILGDVESELLLYEDETAEVVGRVRDDIETVTTYVNVDGDDPAAHDFYGLIDGRSTAEPDAAVHPRDVNIIMYTSGTTGEAKGVVHTHEHHLMQNWATMYEMSHSPDDVGLSMAPLYHSAELHAFFLPRIHAGSVNVLQHSFDPVRTLEIIEEYGVTVTFGAPTMWVQILQAGPGDYGVGTLDTGIYAGSTISPSVAASVMDAFGCGLVNYYGMTEIGPCATVSFAPEQRAKPGCAGHAVLNHEVRIVDFDDGRAGSPSETVEGTDTGHVIVRGPTIMEEYLNKPEETAEVLREGWYYTGDVGHRDGDGAIWIVDRADDMIISGAENIYPTEVENVLLEHSGVVEGAVIGKPDEEWGEVVYAFVIADGDVTADELDDFLLESDELADFKRPREYGFVDEMPTTASGKIQKYKLRERVS